MLSPLIPSPDDLSDREREEARWHPEQETLALAATGAAKVLGPDHNATKAFAKAAATMGRGDLWHARQAMKNTAPRPAPRDRGGGGRVGDARAMSEILTALEIEQLARFDGHWRVCLAGDNRLLAQGPGAAWLSRRAEAPRAPLSA